MKMSLGCYIISTKEILINKEAVKDKTRHISPEKLIINEDSIFIYGDEDENQLIEKILSVEGVHRYGVFSLIFGTLNVYYKDRVKNTLNKLKKADINTYNEVKRLLYTDSKNTGSSKSMNKALVNKFCTNCGTKIIVENKFCTTCGEKIIIKPTPSNFEKPKHIKSDFSADQNIKNIELVHQAKIKNAIKNHENKKEKVSKGTTNNNTLIVIFSMMFVILLCVILYNSYKSNGSIHDDSDYNYLFNEEKSDLEWVFSKDSKTPITLINNTDKEIFIAFGFRYWKKTWSLKTSSGWWGIPPRTEKVITIETIMPSEIDFKNPFLDGMLYIYAEDSDGISYEYDEGEGEGEDFMGWIKDDPFFLEKNPTYYQSENDTEYKDYYEIKFMSFKIERNNNSLKFD
jgi:DNA-directed RNA polymerase subunit RPC12/RpoP